MKLTSTIISLVALFSFASAVNIAYNSEYNNPASIITRAACSGILHQKIITLSNLPNFGASEEGCGTCWQITFAQTQSSIYILSIDYIKDGLQVSHAALKTLTNGNTNNNKTITAEAMQFDRTKCGVPV
jgi:ABC-type microcin C transport system permease subunit YejE